MRQVGIVAAAGILSLEKMTKRFESVPPRSLTGFRTAYPRVSKMFQDPPEGLATVEALFLALHILGRPTEGLLDQYRWREEFLRANQIMSNQARSTREG